MSATIDLGRVVGYSAYEIAVQEGFVGTEAEWLESLKGVNKFKGWFDTSSALSTAVPSPEVGDYAYVHDASPATTVSIYRCSTAGTWADSGSDLDTADVHAYIPVSDTVPSGGMLPNVLYQLGTITGSASFELASATDNTIVNLWCWTFDTDSTAPTITWPVEITSWGGVAPTIRANKNYEVSVMDGIGVWLESNKNS